METAWTTEFERACREWQAHLGLTDWTLYFKIDVGDGTTEATVLYDCDIRTASFTAYCDVAAPDPPERTALHEMLHLLLADLIHTTAARASDSHPDVGREEHKAIERLVNAIKGRL